MSYSYLDQNTQSARVFFKLVANYCKTANSWDNVILYDVKPDEAYNAPLISYRVYGNFDEHLTILAAAGIDGYDIEIKQKQLVLPNSTQLRRLKEQAIFESSHKSRRNGKPRWSRG